MEVLNAKIDKMPPTDNNFINNGNHHHRTVGNNGLTAPQNDLINSSSHSASPGSMSGRSSNSSLNSGIPRNSSGKKEMTVSFRNVCISEYPIEVKNGEKMAKDPTCTQQRPSLINASAEKKAKKVRFFINSDKFFKGATIAVSGEKFRTFDKLLEHLSRIMCNQVTLPQGVRHIFGLDGRPVEEVDKLHHGANYVCSSSPVFKKMDYLKIAVEQDGNSWNKMKRETCYLGHLRRDAFKNSGHSKSFGADKAHPADSRFRMKPRIIAVLKSGLRPRKAVRVLLNGRNTKSLDTLLADLTGTVKLDTGAVRKVFTLAGKPVVGLPDFADSEVFVAYGADKCSSDDFDLDAIEFRNVQAILKSPDLDARYEKYSAAAAASPKTSRRKFLSSRLPARRKRKTSSSSPPSSASKTGERAERNDESAGLATTAAVATADDSPHFNVPPAVSAKYVVGDVIGDGNFAVVRRCRSRRAGSRPDAEPEEFALKIIDKSKCEGKEHMMESEVAILTLVSPHPNIIGLVDVFDSAGERYLVTEYVPGGDLFDAIAADTKYSEPVSRAMVADLASALKYLHDKMIVHRDVKPENLLVVGRPPRSLKLADFGLAQLVSEPLFTVCGTPTYVAPEILAETGYGVKVDVWAAGVITYILLAGFPPFSSRTNNQEELFDQILSGLFEFNAPDWDGISGPAKELVAWMLQVDPLQRYSAYDVLQHPWIADTP